MLIEFSVANFRSIRDEQKFSLLPASDKEHRKTHVVEQAAPGVDGILRSAVLYGANAAGKSNLVLALDVMSDIVAESLDSDPAAKIKVEPFCLDESVDLPTKLEAVFVVDGVRFQYGFLATSERVVEEWLYAYPEKRAQEWFYRKLGENGYEWKFGSHFKGQKNLWSSSTRDNALFLSAAVQLNSEQLRPVYDFFRMNLRVNLSGELRDNFSKELLGSVETKLKILNFLRKTGVEISDLDVRERTISEEEVAAVRRYLPEEQQEKYLNSGRREVFVQYQKAEGKPVWISLRDESKGTQKLFSFAGPILDVLENGYTFVVDELNNSLHPLLARRIVEIFHDPSSNNKGAQLILVTHASSMLDQDLFRRDQIWFAEKDAGFATKIYPLTDFSPRKDASLEKGYLQGRYGAIPFLSQELV